MKFPEEMGLDGVYYRVKRGDEWCNRCFSDLTEAEQDKFMEKYEVQGLATLCRNMLTSMRNILDFVERENDKRDKEKLRRIAKDLALELRVVALLLNIAKGE